MMEYLETFLNNLNYWYWFGFAIILFIFELLAGGGFLFWIAIAAVGVGLSTWLVPVLTWPFQLLLFGLGAVGSAIAWWLHLKRRPLKTDFATLNRRNEQYIGRVFTLQEPIVNGVGRIKVDDSMWRVEGEDLPAGSKVKIVGVDGVILKAEKITSRLG